MERNKKKIWFHIYESNDSDTWEYAITDKEMNVRKKRSGFESREDADVDAEREALNILTSL